QRIEVGEYYRWIFENSVPGLPAEAAKRGLTPLEYMRRFGAFLVNADTYAGHMEEVPAADLAGAATDPQTGAVTQAGEANGIVAGGKPRVGFKTPSKRLELYSDTLASWGWPEHALPGYIKSHVHRSNFDAAKGQYVLVPTFRLPTLIHTRSANAKWLYELSNANPVWMSPEDGARIGVQTGELVRVTTRIGHFVNRAWVTDGVRPGVVACSHHLGRWRLQEESGGERWSTALVDLKQAKPGQWMMRQIHGIQPFSSGDPDSSRIHWEDAGGHQNLVFPVH